MAIDPQHLPMPVETRRERRALDFALPSHPDNQDLGWGIQDNSEFAPEDVYDPWARLPLPPPSGKHDAGAQAAAWPTVKPLSLILGTVATDKPQAERERRNGFVRQHIARKLRRRRRDLQEAQRSFILPILPLRDPGPVYKFAMKLSNTPLTRYETLTSLTILPDDPSANKRSAELPGTIYGMSILHRSHVSVPIQNLRLRSRYMVSVYVLFNRYKGRELTKSGAPKTAVDFALVLLGSYRRLDLASLRVEQLWGPAVAVKESEDDDEMLDLWKFDRSLPPRGRQLDVQTSKKSRRPLSELRNRSMTQFPRKFFFPQEPRG
ncbi:hypothetical protein F4821DRAFT_260698 [Hypoxylon rubiginosum]|uniref:Uncharacterized protein n=1 Tax=Hypoxylon rubiginosum TaxID=110542 RepID=A0ACC0CZ71_9PEZI|nr:hypothetical protein F4821DRAFT_260698 [Hypoxylon rubiginosum]